MSDFVIENGVLTNYIGKGGDVVISEGVTSIGEDAFHGRVVGRRGGKAKTSESLTFVATGGTMLPVKLPDALAFT